MTQIEKIEWLFKLGGGRITNRDLQSEGLLHTGRNRIREFEKRVLAPKGETIEFKGGSTFLEHCWTIVAVAASEVREPIFEGNQAILGI